MKRTRIILIWIWLIVGSALALFSVIDGFRAMGDSRRGEAQAAALGLMFSAVVVLGAVQSKRGRRSGPPVLHVASVLVLLYAAAYFLFGGVEDTGWGYASLVGALLALSFITLASLRREVQHGP